MMHYHGEFNLITPENVKNLKIINDYIIHYRGHNCTLLTSQRCLEPLLMQWMRFGLVNFVKAPKSFHKITVPVLFCWEKSLYCLFIDLFVCAFLCDFFYFKIRGWPVFCLFRLGLQM